MLFGRFVILTPLCGMLFGAQSVTVGASASVTLPNSAPWTTIGGKPMRWEMRLHGLGSNFPTSPTVAPVAFELREFSDGSKLMASNDGYGPDTIPDGVVFAPNCCAGRTDMLVRVQRDVANTRFYPFGWVVIVSKQHASTIRILQPHAVGPFVPTA